MEGGGELLQPEEEEHGLEGGPARDEHEGHQEHESDPAVGEGVPHLLEVEDPRRGALLPRRLAEGQVAKSAAENESPAARNPGARIETCRVSSPPRSGPNVKPSPNAAPISPIPLARSFSVVTSAM